MIQGRAAKETNPIVPKYQQKNMPFQRKDTQTTNIFKPEARTNGNINSFRTDIAISGGKIQGERVLQRWTSDTPTDGGGLLETPRNKTTGAWDQFAENKRLFGLTTDYNENIYTTSIDRAHPQYKQRVAEANKKAKEIERSVTTNPHVAEERILDNIDSAENGIDEEDKYSGVQRPHNFPALPISSGNKYMPPGRRAAVMKAPSSNVPVDPAIISSQLARHDKITTEKPDAQAVPIKTSRSDIISPKPAQTTSMTPENKTQVTPPSNSSRNSTPFINLEGVVPNATATVERDVASAFKNFASQQRKNVDQIRISRAKNDKEVKLNDLKAFANNFKLHTPVPSDLVPIIAKDPKKQREIQAKAQRNAEEAESSKTSNSDSTKPTVSISEARNIGRPTPSSHGSSPSNVPSRPNNGRNLSFAQQSPLRGTPQKSLYQNRVNFGNRLRGLENKLGQLPSSTVSTHDIKPPNGPSTHKELSTRPMINPSIHAARLNPNSTEFHPSPHSTPFHPSSGSIPRPAVNGNLSSPVTCSVLRRKPVDLEERPSILGHFDALSHIKSLRPPTGREMAWKATGGIRPAYDTPPVWKQATQDDKQGSSIRLTYQQLLNTSSSSSHAISSPNPMHVYSQAAHHQHIPIRLQQGSHNLTARQSPRQEHLGLHGNSPGQAQTFSTGPEDHRMVISHSAQSFVSPRLQNIPMAYQSPINQSAHLAYNPQVMQFGGAPPMQPSFRSLSNSHQFLPQQNPMGQMIIPSPSGAFISSQAMTPGPQMIFQGNQPPSFIPVTNGHPPPIPSVNSYPSPGRAAPMMVSQGSQQSHQPPIYGINPSMSSGHSYGSPMFVQPPPPVQMPIRPFIGPSNQTYGAGPQQLHQFGSQGRRNNHTNSNYTPNKSFHNPQSQSGASNKQASSGSQPRGSDSNDEAK